MASLELKVLVFHFVSVKRPNLIWVWNPTDTHLGQRTLNIVFDISLIGLVPQNGQGNNSSTKYESVCNAPTIHPLQLVLSLQKSQTSNTLKISGTL